MDKVSIYGSDVRKGIQSGVNKLVDPVKITLGARGKLVGIYNSHDSSRSLRGLHVTKDGYTVAKNVVVESNKVETIGIDLVNQIIKNTNSNVGDATTTTAIMAQYLINRGLKSIENEMNPLKISEGLNLGLDWVRKAIEQYSLPVDDSIEKIATISGNNKPEIGSKIAEAFDAAGRHENSSIKIFETTDNETTVEKINGYKLHKGFLRESFINHPSRVKCVYKNPYIIMIHGELSSFRDFIPLLSQAQKKQRPLVIIADRFKGEFLNSIEISINAQLRELEAKGGGYFQHIGLVQNPMALKDAKDLYDDMAVVTGSQLSSLSLIVNDVDIDKLGEAEEIEIYRTKTLIIGGKGDQSKVDDMIKKLEAQLEDDKDLTDHMKLVLRDRIESLSGSHANIRVGGKSEAEIKEAKDLFDDALSAVRASIKEGIVAGGGVTLLRIAEEMKGYKQEDPEVQKGWELIIGAIEAPFYQIMKNAEESHPDLIAKEVLESPNNFGYNVLTRQYSNMIDEGIIDPAMAERVALENAVSVANIVYNMGCALVEDLS